MKQSFSIDGKQLSQAEFGRIQTDTSVFVNDNGDISIMGFTKNDNFLLWKDKSNHKTVMNNLNKKIIASQKFEKETNTMAILKHKILQEGISYNMKSLANEMKLELSDLKLLNLATSNSPIEPSILNSVILWEKTNYSGRSLFMLGGAFSYPDFGWFNFKNKANSLFLTLGYLILFDKTWFRGQQRHFVTNVPWTIPNLNGWGIATSSESAIH